MKIKTVSVTYDRKINLGDFNSATVGVTLWADVDEGESTHKVMTELWEMATNNVRAKAELFMKKNEAQVKEIFLGLPAEYQKEIEPCPSSN